MLALAQRLSNAAQTARDLKEHPENVKEYEQFFGPGSFPLSRLKEAESEPGVVAARPFYAMMSFWRCPPYPVESAANPALNF